MRHASHRGAAAVAGKRRHGVVWNVLGVLMEILFTLAAVCALYIVWQMWWTGVQAEHEQVEARQSVAWESPATDGEQTKVAPKQEGDPPVQPEQAAEGDLIAQIYIPRFGDQWERNIVEGTTLEQYHYTTFKIVTPDHTEVVAANPESPGAAPTKRMITLTTCEPKYTTATHRWISYGEFDYWAKVSDGVPAELTTTDESGAVRFVNTEQPTPIEQLGSMQPVVIAALIAYMVLFIAAAVAWRWPVLREIREGVRPRPDVSFYGWLLRHQPGVMPIRWLLVLLLAVAAAGALLEWGYPWLAANIPFLRDMSNYVAV